MVSPPTQSSTCTAAPAPRRGAGALADLRRRTAVAHRALEDRLDLLAPGLTAERYAQVLQRFAAVHLTLDEVIAAWLGSRVGDPSVDALEPQLRRRMPWLRADLVALGRPLPAPVSFRVPSFGEALGAMYVVEGSTLGGRTIVPHVRRALGSAVPTAYFSSYGDRTMPMWSSFRRGFGELVATRDDLLAAARGAVRTFDLFTAEVGS